MKYKAVLTGDIVDSSKTIEYRKNLLKVIKDTCEKLSNYDLTSLEIFRGDSFQILLDRPELAVRTALILRCALKAASPLGSSLKWDARISIGIGTIDYYDDSISTSDGEAFRFSGRGLDTLKKRRLSIQTPWEDFNEEISICTAFVDSLVTSWSIKKSYLILNYLTTEISKKDLAELLGLSPQNLSQRLKDAQVDNVDMYLDYFKNKVKKLTTE